MWSESRGLLLTILSIPLLAYFTHHIFTQNLGDGQVARLVNEAVAEWAAAPKMDFVAKPSLVTGPAPDQASLVLSEFADFRCSHCKRASYTLHAFVKAHPDVRFEFYSFPLDGACNEKISQGSGLSCRLAAVVYCAEKDGKGWEMHDLLFEKQETVNGLGTAQEIDSLLAKEVPATGLNWETVQRCADQPETMDAIKAQAKQGGLVNVQGTPTLFADGRMLSRGNILPVLQAVHERAKAKR
jgi:protein-disulfide isomerase